jgi:hypothetical protein
VELGKAVVGRFSDGEVTVEIQQNVRARDVFVIQPTCAPTNENLMELLIMVDALKRASARRITAVIPYFGYARQDRRPRSTRVPISAKVVANLLETVGAQVGWITNTSRARTFCWISTVTSPSEKRPTTALPSSTPRWVAISWERTGLAFPVNRTVLNSTRPPALG